MEIIKEFHETVIPVITFFIIINVVGFFGNLVIMYIYSFRYEKNHFRRLVLCLSYLDMISCCTTIPMETVSTWYWLRAPSRGLCKLKNFFVQFTALSAIYMFFIIALYKYLRICRQRHVSNKTIVILFVVGICISLLLASPAAILWDVKKEHKLVKDVNVTLRICEVRDVYRHTAYPHIYRNVLSLYALLLIATIVLYIFVAKTIFQHIREKRRKAESYKPKTNARTENTANDRKEKLTNDGEDNKDVEGVSYDKVTTDRKLMESTSFQLSAAQIRKAIIMVILAGVFSITFLMGLSFGYVFAYRDFKDFASMGQIVGLFACYRLYFANYALNFLVYFNLDRAFRSEVLVLFRLRGRTLTPRT